MSRQSFCMVAIAVVVLSLAPKEARAGTLHDALEDYAAGRYEHSREILRQLIADDPSDPRYHYCMGATLLGLKLKSQALAEYRKCMRLGAPAEIRAQCHLAIQAIEGPRIMALQLQKRRADDAVLIARQQTLSHIQLRTDEHRNVTDGIVDKARITAQAIKDEAKQASKDWIANYSIRMLPYGQADEDVAEMQKVANEQAERVMHKAVTEADGRERAYQERKRHLELSATNLESQLLHKQGVRLNPEGTNLYVRSYIH